MEINEKIKLMAINKENKQTNIESPEKLLLQRYYIKQNYVQVILDATSFNAHKMLKYSMNLPKLIFKDLSQNDYFGL